MTSPLSGNSNCYQLDTIDVQFLIESYDRDLDIDISQIFEDIYEVKLFKCMDTGYEFFHPFQVTGNSHFYEQLARNKWYYDPWKWEHEEALKFIEQGASILEVGSGKGDFLIEAARKKNIKGVGLEMNLSAIKQGTKSGAKLEDQTIQEYAKNYQGRYDAICMFQVLEHFADVGDVIKSCVECLKDNGLLIISVPNNDSFLKKDKYNLLNLPPHHMGRWSEKSLGSLENYFGIRFIQMVFEPLQSVHLDWYLNIQINNLIKSDRIKSILQLKSIKWILTTLIHLFKNRIIGHTILAVYQK